uniref:Uncharacterized protein n=1 Tax=Anguilla anguilla TaxID=7936 RepID=A0A0E9UJG0_ANGAN
MHHGDSITFQDIATVVIIMPQQ